MIWWSGLFFGVFFSVGSFFSCLSQWVVSWSGEEQNLVRVVGDEWLSRNSAYLLFFSDCHILTWFWDRSSCFWFRKCLALRIWQMSTFFLTWCCCWSSLHSTVPNTVPELVLMKNCQSYTSLEFHVALRNRELQLLILGGSQSPFCILSIS